MIYSIYSCYFNLHLPMPIIVKSSSRISLSALIPLSFEFIFKLFNLISSVAFSNSFCNEEF